MEKKVLNEYYEEYLKKISKENIAEYNEKKEGKTNPLEDNKDKQ